MNIKRCISIILIIIFACCNVFAQGKKALIVAISDYPPTSGFDNIHGENDAEIISKTLKINGFNIMQLLGKNATAENIRKQLKQLIINTKQGDFVYIHFSCHGQPFQDFAPYDEDDGWDESIVAYDAQKYYNKGIYEGENHILDDELSNIFSKIRQAAGKNGFLCVTVVACHAGGMSRDDDDDEQIIRGTNIGFSADGKKFMPKICNTGNYMINSSDKISDILILEACRSYQFNAEINVDGKYYGPLSYYVAKVLENEKLNKNSAWVLKVKNLMIQDNSLNNQNMVIESSFF